MGLGLKQRCWAYQDDDPDRVVREQQEAEDHKAHANCLVHSCSLKHIGGHHNYLKKSPDTVEWKLLAEPEDVF